jgi:ribosomal protein S18 acetylase RimI-like enzyme
MKSNKKVKLELRVDENISFMEIFMNNRCVGVGRYSEQRDETIFIEDFNIDFNLRGLGIGSSSVDLMKKYFEKRGFKKIRLSASQGNEEPYEKTPYDFWVLSCGFIDTPDKSYVEFPLRA